MSNAPVPGEQELYYPESDFLNLLLDEEIGVGDDPFGRANLQQLIRLTYDADRSNRDWAVFLLSQSECDDEAIRAALRRALNDEAEDVRLEALVGIAKREPATALPTVTALLGGSWVSSLAVEAASYVADGSLVALLEALPGDPDDQESWQNSELRAAIEACSTGVQPQWRNFT